MNKDKTRYTLRMVAGMYLLYLAYQIFTGLEDGGADPMLMRVVAAAFIVIGALFIYVGVKNLIIISKTAELDEEDEETSETEEEVSETEPTALEDKDEE